MKSFTELRNLFGTLCNNSATDNLTFGDELLNMSIREICTSFDWNFLERNRTASTVAGTQFYELPGDCEKVNTVTIISSTTQYLAKECPSREYWDYLNSNTDVRSVSPEWFFVYNGQLGFYPIPSTAITNGINYRYLRKIKNLSIADYTTGTVDIITAAGAVTGSSTTWTAPMIGRYLRVTPSNTAAADGDGLWYEIATRTSNTVIGLTKVYLGTALATGASAAYAIAEVPILPEAYHTLPVYKACEIYFSTRADDLVKADKFKKMFDEGLYQMRKTHGRKTTNVVVHSTDMPFINPNLSIRL